MMLTAFNTLLSAKDQLATPAAQLANFMAGVLSEAKKNLESNVPASDDLEFGVGSVRLAFRIRDGVGSSATIPWSLIAYLAKDFERAAREGNPAAFRAIINGPWPKNIQGLEPWVEVVLVVGGNTLMSGYPWSIY